MGKRVTIFISIFTLIMIILFCGIRHIIFHSAHQIVNRQSASIIQKIEGTAKNSQHRISEPGNQEKRQSMNVGSKGTGELKTLAMVNGYPYEIEELKEAEGKLAKEAEELLARARQLSDKGREEDALEYEHKALELEAQANDLRVQAEASLQEANHGKEELPEIERKKSEEYTTQTVIDGYPYEIEELKEAEGKLAKEAEELLARARQLNDKGREEDAMEYEHRALECEAQANDLRVKAEASLQEANHKEGHEIETGREVSEGYAAKAIVNEYHYEPWELKAVEGQLVKEAEDIRSSARQLNDKGYEEEAMEYEHRALEIEAQANDLRVKAEASLQEANHKEDSH